MWQILSKLLFVQPFEREKGTDKHAQTFASIILLDALFIEFVVIVYCDILFKTILIDLILCLVCIFR